MKMKRVDFLYGVVLLSVDLLLLLFVQVYGYLDAQTHVLVTSKSSFYEFLTEPIPVYTYYRLLIYILYIYKYISLFLLVCFLWNSSMRRITRFQLQCYRPYFPYHCMMCFIPCVLRYANMTANISDDIIAQVEWKRIGLIISSILRFIFSFLLFELRKYKFWRHILYIFATVIHDPC